MTPIEVAATLRQFNGWRRDFEDKFEQPDAREISEAIDAAIEMIERLDELAPQPYAKTMDHNGYYAKGWNDCLTAALEKSK